MLKELVTPILVVAGFAAAHRYYEQGRSASLRAFAASQGFRFAPGPGDLPEGVAESGHPGDTPYNIMTGNAGGIDLTVFDCLAAQSEGYFRTPLDQTYLVLSSGAMDFPRFTLQPKRLSHRIGNLFGARDIPFTDRESLTGRYVLRSPEEEAAASLFTAPLLGFLEGHGNISLEGGGRGLKYYKNAGNLLPAPRVAAAAMGRFLEEGLFITGSLGVDAT